MGKLLKTWRWDPPVAQSGLLSLCAKTRSQMVHPENGASGYKAATSDALPMPAVA
jgi:hypothetical protein